jgi:hypothetical protein
MNGIRYTFKDLVEGDEIIVTDFVSKCDYYQVASIGKCETRWHFLLECHNGDTTKYVTFWVNDLEHTHEYLEDGRVVYVNAVDFLEDCDARRDRIKELKDNFINNKNN